MTLDDLRNLNPRDIGNWPVLPKLGALVILLVLLVFAGYWFDWKGQLETLASARAKEQQLRDSFLDKKKQAVNLEAYRRQLAEIEESFGEMLKQLPNKSEMEALLTDINQAGLGRGLQFELFRPGQSVVKDYYAELPIALRVSGRYHDVGAFAADVSNLSRIVTLHNISIEGNRGGGADVLVMEATARTYRYLDSTELDSIRKPNAAKKPGGNP